VAVANSSASPGARNTSSTMIETVRACNYLFPPPSPSHASHTFFLYSHHSSPRRRFCFNTELSSCLCPETIHVGESCAQSRNRTRYCAWSYSCSRRGNARPVVITDTNIIAFHPCSILRLFVFITVSWRFAVPRTQGLEQYRV
jgi:hypothetical protein